MKENQQNTGKKIAIKPKLPFKAVFPGKYIQAEQALSQLPDLIELLGKNGLILASPTAKNKIIPAYNLVIAGKDIPVEGFRGECCEEEIARVSELVRNKNFDVIVGMGGGKTIDTAKIVADRAGIPVIIVPTIASTDAPCSGCAVIYSKEGIFESVYYENLNPQIVLVDMNIIANSPTRFLVSGMGDALATWFEARSCQQSQSVNACGGLSTLAALNLAELCCDTLLQYGPAAIIANDNHVVTPALNHIVEANILLSGLGFESAGLASAHSVHNGLTALPETHAYYHGEKVAFGLLTGLHLSDADPEEIDLIYSFCEEIGLPTTFKDLGVTNLNKERLMEVAVKTCAPEECIHHEAVEINPEKVMNAMIVADAMGTRRKKQ